MDINLLRAAPVDTNTDPNNFESKRVGVSEENANALIEGPSGNVLDDAAVKRVNLYTGEVREDLTGVDRLIGTLDPDALLDGPSNCW